MHLHLENHYAEIILLLFLIVVFLQSGVDKIKDWKGNLSWLTSHFAQSPFKNSVPILLGIITFFEMVAGLSSLIGLVHLVVFNHPDFAFYGALTSAITLLMLLFGQRLAKDYEGAKTIVIYLIPTVFLLFLLQ